MTLALLVARSGLVDLGNEALSHVKDLPVHLVACVHALGRKPEVRFIQLPHPSKHFQCRRVVELKFISSLSYLLCENFFTLLECFVGNDL